MGGQPSDHALDAATDPAALLAASYLRFMEEAAAALAAPDPDLDEERAVMAQHYAAPAEAHPYQPGDPDDLRDGLLAGFRPHRPPPASSPTSDEETPNGRR